MILLSGATETGIAEDVATRAGRTGSPGKARAGDRDRDPAAGLTASAPWPAAPLLQLLLLSPLSRPGWS